VLSSWTAAEYGNVAALQDRLTRRRRLHRNVAGGSSSSSLSMPCDSGGNTPLHFAAQHGHVAACLLLLQQQQSPSQSHPDDAIRALINASDGGATPLHRASFSGAVGTMQLLVQYPQCDLLARDTSFGDAQTPLHKAVSGGRYLAVQLLVTVLQERGWLSQALTMVDARGDTPLDVALDKCHADPMQLAEYAQAVARWNQVAGGLPDWEQCATILQVAAAANQAIHTEETQLQSIEEPMCIEMATVDTRTTTASSSRAQRSRDDSWKASISTITPPDCADCDDCLAKTTVTWEAAFRAALGATVPSSNNKNNNSESGTSKDFDVNDERISKEETVVVDTNDSRDDAGNPSAQIQSINMAFQPPPPRASETTSHFQGPDTIDISMGRACDSCQALCMALFPKDGKLVCRACYRRRRRR